MSQPTPSPPFLLHPRAHPYPVALGWNQRPPGSPPPISHTQWLHRLDVHSTVDPRRCCCESGSRENGWQALFGGCKPVGGWLRGGRKPLAGQTVGPIRGIPDIPLVSGRGSEPCTESALYQCATQ